jgi:hypothetical protein
MVETITLSDAKALMRTGKPFDIEVAHLDGTRGIYTGARLNNISELPEVKVATDPEVKDKSRNPLHHTHGTANIKLPNNDIRKIYPVLIESFNGKTMII